MNASDSEDLLNSRYHEALRQAQRALAETQALYRVARSLIRFQDLADLLQSVVDSVAAALPANRVTLIMFALETQQVTHFIKGGLGVADVVNVSFDELWDGLSGWALRELEPALSAKTVPDPRESPEVRRRRAETNCGAIIVVPLHYQGKPLGTMTAINRPEDTDFTQRDVELMMGMAGQTAIAVENVRLYEELQSSNADLECRVQNRTTELSELNRRLQAEIAERKHTEENMHEVNRAFQALSRCNQALLRISTESDLLTEICHIIKEECGYRQVWIGFVVQDVVGSVRLMAQAGFDEGYIGIRGIIGTEIRESQTPTGIALQTHKPVIYQAVLTDPLYSALRDEATALGYTACAAFPLLTKGKVLGTLNVYSIMPDAFESQEVSLLVELANDLAYGIMVLRERAQSARTAQALQNSERRYRLLVENMNDGLVLIDPDTLITYTNPRFCDLLSYTSNELIGQPLGSLLDPLNREIFTQHFAKWRQREQSVYELDWLTKDGRGISTRVSGTPLLGDQREFQGSFAVVTDITERKQAEKERLAHLWFLEGMDQVSRAMQGTNDLEQTMRNVLDVLLTIFDCDRAWLVHPCDPESPTWQVLMERTRPEYPGVLPLGVELPLDPVGAAVYRILRDSPGAAQFGPGSVHQVPIEMAQGFSVQSFIAMAFYPKVGKPWAFGLHQCSYPRVWTPQEERLFQEIGRRLADTLTSLLVFRSLQESEKQFRLLADNSMDMISRHTPDGVYLYVSPSCQTLLGYEPAELIGRNPYEFYHPEDIAAVRQSHTTILDQPVAYTVRYRRRRKDGQYVWFETISKTIRDNQTDAILEIQAASRDITERKKAEDALRESEVALKESELRYRQVFDNVSDCLYLLEITDDSRFRNLEVNPALEQSVGLSRAQLIGKTQEETVSEETARVVNEKYRYCVQAGVSTEEEAELDLPTGHRYYQSILIPVRDDTGRIYRIIGVSRDVTEQKQAAKALHTSEEQFRLLADNSMDLISRHSPDGVYLYVSPSCRALLGYEPEDLVGHSAYEFFHPDDVPVVTQSHNAILDQPITYTVRYRIRRKDGQYIWFETISKTLRDSQTGAAIEIQAGSRDITERRRAEDALRQSEKRFSAIFHTSPVCISISHIASGRYIDVNEAGLTMHGYSREEMLSGLLRVSDVWVYPEERTAYEKLRQEHGGVRQFEYTFRKKSGELGISLVSSERIKLDGEDYSVAFALDITERKQAETVLRRQNEYLTALHEMSLAIMNRLNSEDLLNTILNRAVELIGTAFGSIFLFSPDKTKLTAVIYTGYPKDLPIRSATPGKGLAGTVWQTGEMQVINDYQNWPNRSTGTIPDMIRANLGIPLKSGDELIGILCVDYHEEGRTFSKDDIAILTRFAGLASVALDNARLYSSAQQELVERKQAEEALRRYNKRLSVLREIDRDILLTRSPDSMARVVLEQLTQLIPCEFASIVLYNVDMTEERVFALQATADISIPAGESHPVVWNQVLERLKAGQSVVTYDLTSTTEPLARMAEELVNQGAHSAMATPMIAQGQLIGVLALAARSVGFFTIEHQQIAEDLSTQIAIALHQAKLSDQIARYNTELEQRVQERTTALETANRELEVFTYSISHDLRAPLRAIQGFAEIIVQRHRNNLNEEGRHYFDNIVVAGQQMDELILNLLTYARLGRQSIQWSNALSLGAILSKVINNLASDVEETDAQIYVAENLPLVQGDQMLLKRIFTNLLQNTLVYHQPGIPPKVRISAVTEADHIIIRVSDNGIGIAPEFREKIFNVFYRLHNQEQYPGTGIGLAVVRKSVEMLNGTVWVESEVMKGSTFCVKLLPAKEDENYRDTP